MEDDIPPSAQVVTLHQLFHTMHKRIAKRACHYGLNLLHLLVYFPGDISEVLSSLLCKCPQAAKDSDKMGNTPFHHAVSSTRHNMNSECFDQLKKYSSDNLVHQSILHYKKSGNWYEVKEAVEAKVEGLKMKNSESGLFPFMMLAEEYDEKGAIGVNYVYELLRMSPDVLKGFDIYNSSCKLGEGEEEDENDLDNTNKKKRKHELLE